MLFTKKRLVSFVVIAVWVLLYSALQATKNSYNVSNQMRLEEPNFTSFRKIKTDHLPVWLMKNSPEWHHHPEFGILPFNAPCSDCVEVLEKRTATERYFVDVNDPSLFYLQKSVGPLHYLKNGLWQTIDHHIAPIGNGVYEASNQWDATGFDLNQPSAYIITTEGKIEFNNWKLWGHNGQEETLLALPDWSQISIGEDGVYITEIFPGIDAQMQVMRGSIKTNFIINRIIYNNYKYLVFTDSLSFLPDCHMIFEENDGTPALQKSGKVLLVKKGKPVLEIATATAYGKHFSEGETFALDYRINGNRLSVIVPVDKVLEHIKNGPLIIDPLVSSSNTLAQAAITGSQYNANCNFVNSCNHTLTVNTPAGATFTDIQWSFVYTATFPCVMRDGAVRIRTGTCISPSQSGFFWYCNSPLPGNCTGDTISIFSELSSCLPTPSCVPQPVTFELQFFRSCAGTPGCNNSCIGAGSPWTMHIKGRTLEFTNPSNTITLSQNTICFGQTVTASTLIRYGVAPYSVNWSFNPNGTPSIATGSSAVISFPAPGTYNLYAFITDACGTTISDQRLINVNPIPTVTAASNSPICQGQTLNLTVNTTPAASYNWSGPNNYNTSQQNPSINNALPSASGTYTVTVSVNGCTASGSTQVVVNPRPTASISPANATVCAGSSVTLTASGGTSFSWSTNETTASVTVSPLSNTSYTVTVTDANGCTATASRSVSVGNPPNPNITPANAAVCSGNSITLTSSGGTSYLWNTNQTTASINVSPAANSVYSVTVTGANGCTAVASRNVTVNAPPVININPAVASVCTGSSITLSASGANSYVWSNNATTASIAVSPIANTTYSVTGTDANGCTASATRDVTIASNLTINITPANASVCSGASVTLTASGALNYVWSNNATTSSITVSPISNTTYSVTGTDANGCTGTASRNVILNPDPVLSVTPAQAVICEGASATLSASGAVNYVWSNNATTSSITVSPISNTTYSVTGTDANGCTAVASRQVTVNPPPAISIQPADAAVCQGESIALIASGGITYVWSNNETTSFITVSPATQTTYSVSVTDANGCTATLSRDVTVNPLPVAAINPPYTQICPGQQLTLTASGGVSYLWSTSETTSSINILTQSAASYSVTVTDANNCSATASADVDIINNLSVSEQHNDVSCFNGNNGTIDISIIYGTAPFTYLWNDNVTTEDRTGLSAGAYSLTVSDSDGCAATITIDITQPAAITVSETITNESCAGSEDGSITLTTNGGTAPYNYLWSDNDNANPKNNLASGNYSVTITDNYGCSINRSYEVGRNAAINISSVVNNPSCLPAADGSIELTVNGGNGGFVFQWSDNTVRQNAYNLLPGVYAVTVTDSKGCTATAGPFTLAYQYVFSISATPLDTTITKGLGAQINVLPNTYHAVQYTWIPPDGLSCNDCPSPIARPLQTTTYKVIATNAAGCSDSTTVIIQVKNPGAIYIPNSFSPNGDGANDFFMIYGIKPEFLESFHISVFDRWGERVFFAEEAGFAWDGTYRGKLLDPGIFIYHVKFVLQGGDVIEERKGSLLLLR